MEKDCRKRRAISGKKILEKTVGGQFLRRCWRRKHRERKFRRRKIRGTISGEEEGDAGEGE